MSIIYKYTPSDTSEEDIQIIPEAVNKEFFTNGAYICAFSDGLQIDIVHDYEAFVQMVEDHKEESFLIPEPEKDHINPSHYKSLLVITKTDGTEVDTLQWLEHLQYKPFWRNNMHAFVHAVMDLCSDKYLSRMGMKDDETQEMLKSLWYHKFATAVMVNGYKPIRVVDIERLLGNDTDLLTRYLKLTIVENFEANLRACGFNENEVKRIMDIKNEIS